MRAERGACGVRLHVPLRRIAAAISCCAWLHGAHADEPVQFDRQLLELGGGAAPADLSSFSSVNRLRPGSHLVRVVVNGAEAEQREIAFADDPAHPDADATPCVTRAMLDAWGVNVAAFPRLANAAPDACIDVASAIDGAAIAFDTFSNKLDVSIPQAALKRQARGWVDPSRRDQGAAAALFGYQINAAQYSGSNYGGSGPRMSLYAGFRTSVNIGAWRLVHDSSFDRGLNGSARYQIIDTYAQRDVAPLNGRLTLGEGTTPSSVFDAFQFRGVQLNSDESMLPDSQRGYAPTIHGVAQTNAQVTVRQNGYVIYNAYVPPGPFVIDDLYATPSSGDLEVTITEADGRARTFIQPYSAVPLLLRAGAWRYGFTAGQYNDGATGLHPAFAMATLARGLPRAFSLYGGLIGASMYRAAMIGVSKNLGNIGAVSFDVTHAQSDTGQPFVGKVVGNSYRLLYSKSLAATGTDVRVIGYRYSTSGYRSFADAVDERAGVLTNALGARRSRFEATVNQTLGAWGSAFATIGVQTYANSAKSDLFQLGYTGRIGRVSYGVFGGYAKGSGVRSNWQVSANVSIPFGVLLGKRALSGSSANLSMFASRTSDNRYTQQMTLSDTVGSERQIGYNLGVARSGASTVSENASMTYQAPAARIDASVANGRGYTQTTLGVAGGVLAYRGGVLFSQPFGETAAVATVPGARGVRFENQPGVRTNGAGQAVIPNLTPYRTNRIAVDTRTLPDGVDVKDGVVEVVPTRGAVVEAKFDAMVGRQAMFTLTLPDGEPVPLGASVENADGQEVGVVGMGGEAFLSGLPAMSGKLRVKWGADAVRRCEVSYALPETMPKDGYAQIKGICDTGAN